MPKVSPALLAQRRQQILDAAIACFAKKGFHRTTMADIAEDAGVSTGLAYRYFSGKEALMTAALRELTDRSADDADRSGQGDAEDFETLVNLLLSADIRRFAAQPDTKMTMGVRFRSWAEALHDPDVREEVLDRWRHHVAVAEGLVVRAQREGLVAPGLDARAVSRVMLAMHDGLNLQATLDRDVDLERCRQVMLAMWFGQFWSGDRSGRGQGE